MTEGGSNGSRRQQSALQKHVERIIFGTGTPAGQLFDILLIVAILISVTAVVLDSMVGLRARYGPPLFLVELVFTVLFTIEYLVRIWCVRNRLRYVTSLWGIIDLVAILPTYIALLIPGAAPLMIVRLLRVLRIFRVFRLLELMREFHDLLGVLRASSRAIFVFFSLVLIVVVIFAGLLYAIEGPEHGFTSIPMSFYWAVVTITTVGYGDIIPQTPLGRAIASLGMLVGYSIIAVPASIITSKLIHQLTAQGEAMRQILNWNCPACQATGHSVDAHYCKHCGSELDVPEAVREAARKS